MGRPGRTHSSSTSCAPASSQAFSGRCSGQGAGVLGSECQRCDLLLPAHYGHPGVRNTYMHNNLWPSVNPSITCHLRPATVSACNIYPIFGKHPCFFLWGALPSPLSICGWTELSLLPKWLQTWAQALVPANECWPETFLGQPGVRILFHEGCPPCRWNETKRGKWSLKLAMPGAGLSLDSHSCSYLWQPQ